MRPADLGVGIGYRDALRRDILANRDRLGFVEIVSDAFFGNLKAAHALATILPVVPHSLRSSVGSQTRPDYVDHVASLVATTGAPWHSDHLAFTHAGGVSAGHLAPMPFTDDALDNVVANVRTIQSRIDRPFALENITMAFYWPHDTMSEAEFLREVVRRTGCWILLDLENVRVNAANHGARGTAGPGEARAANGRAAGGDAHAACQAFLDALPLDRVAQVHLAGGVTARGLHHDTHSAPVPQATWRLFEQVCEQVRPPAVLIERDAGFPPFGDLLAEVERAKGILEGAT